MDARKVAKGWKLEKARCLLCDRKTQRRVNGRPICTLHRKEA
jgi:hypothetical protein